MTRHLALLSTLALTACLQAPAPTSADITADRLPPIRIMLDCLPEAGAVMAAHRGTDERWDVAENSIGGLEKLIASGIIMAEIDVAGLKDGTLITFHDGVWEEITTGKGPIASSTREDLDNILLKTRDGRLTSERPPTFADMLETAKDKIYIEVDFKSSAKYEDVIAAIRAANMAEHVVLIAYNDGQARKLEALAPDMFRSNPSSLPQAGHAVWLGYNVANDDTANILKSKGSYPIGRIGDPNRQPPVKTLLKVSDILVTDEAGDFKGVHGLSASETQAMQSCLAEKR